MSNSWIIGIVVYIICSTVLGGIEGPTTCSDGWASSSIGRRGACSHHGGVEGRWSPTVSLIIAVVAGVAISSKKG